MQIRAYCAAARSPIFRRSCVPPGATTRSPLTATSTSACAWRGLATERFGASRPWQCHGSAPALLAGALDLVVAADERALGRLAASRHLAQRLVRPQTGGAHHEAPTPDESCNGL